MPDTSATPRKIGEPGREGAQLARRDAAQGDLGHGHFLHQLDHLVGRAGLGVVHHEAVAQHDQPVRVRGRLGIVGDHHDGLAELVDRLAQQLQHLLARPSSRGCRSARRRRHRRLRGERARHRDALLLAARELRGPMRAPVAEADRRDQPLDPLGVGLHAGDRERQHDVLLRRQHRDQVEELEDEAELVAAQLGERGVVEPGDLRAVERDRARGRPVEPGEDVHQGRLARARRAP